MTLKRSHAADLVPPCRFLHILPFLDVGCKQKGSTKRERREKKQKDCKSDMGDSSKFWGKNALLVSGRGRRLHGLVTRFGKGLHNSWLDKKSRAA